jgi:hypothetical protein
MLECIADASIGGAVPVDNWYSKLQSLLALVSHGVFNDPAAIDVGAGCVNVDVCMARWRSHYHISISAWQSLSANPRTAAPVREQHDAPITHAVCY